MRHTNYRRSGSSGNPAPPCTGTVIQHRGRRAALQAISAPGRIVGGRTRARSRGAGLAGIRRQVSRPGVHDPAGPQRLPVLGGQHVPAAARARPVRRPPRPGDSSGEEETRADGRGPDQVWSWDITKLKGPARGIWYLLYVIIDIYSRKVIHWEAWPTENGTLAKEFIEHAIEANGGIAPQAVHADRGTSMTSNTVAGLYARLESTSPTPARTYPTTIRTRRRTSRPSSTAPHSPANSDPSKTSTYSAATSSGITTMNTGTPV